MCLRQVESESEMFSKWRERSRSGKRQLFKFWGKCPSKSADGRGERPGFHTAKIVAAHADNHGDSSCLT